MIVARALVILTLFAGTVIAETAPVPPKKTPANIVPSTSTKLFTSGDASYHTYRVPAIATTKNGTILVFCEGRKNSASDTGDIDILLRRSTDGGQTFSPPQIIFDDELNTCGNPCVVVDHQTGNIILLTTWNHGLDSEAEIVKSESIDTRRVYLTISTDDGQTFSEPNDITDSAKDPIWTWYATGPSNGIQLRLGPKAGRLIIPCDHKLKAPNQQYHSHVIYSDDHGLTWNFSGSTHDGTNECAVIECTDGSLLLNARRGRNVKKTNRITATSNDEGLTWSPSSFQNELIGPRCQASMIRYTPADASEKPIILFSNPASKKERINLTLRASKNEGISWPFSKVLHSGPSAYSSLSVMPNGDIACLFEGGEKHPYEAINFTTIALADLKKNNEKPLERQHISRKYPIADPNNVDMITDAVRTAPSVDFPQAGYEPNSPEKTAIIVTELIDVSQLHLYITAKIEEKGSILILAADHDQNTLSSSRPITESVTEGLVTWKDGWDLTAVQGRKIRLKFVLEKAALYSFQIK
ncbi:MAG: exo-alpha-sialidase [Planctomycetes bacterium]|nr:exo-alpha-sialidase [Planctomycetota bacterium]